MLIKIIESRQTLENLILCVERTVNVKHIQNVSDEELRSTYFQCRKIVQIFVLVFFFFTFSFYSHSKMKLKNLN